MRFCENSLISMTTHVNEIRGLFCPIPLIKSARATLSRVVVLYLNEQNQPPSLLTSKRDVENTITRPQPRTRNDVSLTMCNTNVDTTIVIPCWPSLTPSEYN